MAPLRRFSSKIARLVRRLGTFLYYLPLMVRVGSLSLWQREHARLKTIAVCEARRQRRPFAPVPYRFLVDLYLAENRHEKAAESCEDLMLLGYSSPSLIKKFAYSLCHLERFQQAIELLSHASRTGPHDPWVEECLGNCHFTLGQYSEARGAYLRCLDLLVGTAARARVLELISQVEVFLGYPSGEGEETF